MLKTSVGSSHYLSLGEGGGGERGMEYFGCGTVKFS